VTGCGGTISLTNCSNNSIHDNFLRAVALFSSNYNTIFWNTVSVGEAIFPRAISENERMCIQLYASDYNEVYGNSLLDSIYGIRVGELDFGESKDNNIYQNNITSVGTGVYCSYSSSSTIHANSIADCGAGISLTYSDNNRILGNQIKNCGVSVSIYVSKSNSFYGNNFIDNSQHVSERHDHFLHPGSYFYSVNNRWDNGTTGNYWSNYTGTDSDDDIGDTAYHIYENYTDHYPLMEPADIAVIPEFSSWIILPLFLFATLVVVGIKRKVFHPT